MFNPKSLFGHKPVEVDMPYAIVKAVDNYGVSHVQYVKTSNERWSHKSCTSLNEAWDNRVNFIAVQGFRTAKEARQNLDVYAD